MENHKLQNVVLITGAARRIGKALAIAFHEAGYSILVHYSSSENEAKELCAQLNGVREKSALCLPCKLDSSESLEQFIKESLNCVSDLQLLVNNASRYYPTPVEKANIDDWQQLMDSNLRAPFFLSQAFSGMLKQSKGNIINLADIYAERPQANHSIYNASKAGLVSLTRSLAIDLAPEVRVNAIAPGAILWAENGEEDHQSILDKVPLKRKGSEKDIVDTALFLNSADYVTGQLIQIDGGRSLNI